ncbi:hypothetical protein OAS86_00520 [Gammaproteobacteria bacterium]|nr:hypothetical protein [Gammaproteobacteria bacterium]
MKARQRQPSGMLFLAAIAMIAGCQSAPQLAEELAIPEIPKTETTAVQLKIYNDVGKIEKEALAIYDGNGYQESSSESSIKFFQNALDQANDQKWPEVVKLRPYCVPTGSWIVISIPDDVVQGSARKNTVNIRTADETTAAVDQISNEKESDGNEIYSTTGYYNYAENQIEKELIRIGFNVVDRAKYVAKIKQLNASSFEDISDVIRLAAQDDAVRSDYILQINKLSFDTGRNKISIKSYPQVKEYLNKFPQIAPKVQDTYEYPEYNITFDGKLIEVSTGRISWLGTHKVTSGELLAKSGENIRINMTVRKYPTNQDEIERFIAFQNTPEQRQNRYGNPVSIPEIEYDYSFDFSVIPDLNDLEKTGAESYFQGFREQLIKKAASELIRTVTVEDVPSDNQPKERERFIRDRRQDHLQCQIRYQQARSRALEDLGSEARP